MRPRRLESHELAGLVRIRGAYFFVLGAVAEFILDYRSYDPNYRPEDWEYEFRGGLLTLTPSDGFRFLASLSDRVYDVSSVDEFIRLNGPRRARPIVLIDFDHHRLISTYFDQPLEQHVGEGWTALFADPIAHAPRHIARIWDVGN